MSLAEEMLSTMPLSDDSSTYSADEEPHIVINESRQAIVPNELRTIAVTGDKDIETITFDCVRYWDGNDLSTFAIYLNYVLPDLTTGTYIPEKITTTDGDEFYHFDWQIKNNITVKSGKISFAVTAISTTTNWAGNPIVDKQWSSLPNSDCYIALGIDVSNVPSEEESSAVLGQMSAILEQIQADFDEWLKNSVVQTTGDSTTAVMSQRATTEEFDMLKARLKLYDASYGIIATVLENTYYIAMRNSKQIDNLKSGISDQFETDSSVAYVKDVPPNALPYAEVKKIGGMTRKCANLFDKSKAWNVEQTETGIRFTNTEVSGVPVTLGYLKDIAPNVKVGDSVVFYADCVNAYYNGQLHLQGSSLDWHQGSFHTITQADLNAYVFAYGAQNLVCEYNNMRIVKIAGTPYEPYFEGLRSAKVTEVKSVGVNLFGGEAFANKIVEFGGVKNESAGTVYLTGGYAEDKIAYTNFKANTQYTFIIKASTKTLGGINLIIKYTDGTRYVPQSTATDTAYVWRVVSESGKTVEGFVGAWQSNTTYYYNECGIFEGVLALDDFEPYVDHTLPIPEELRPANGINENVYDFIEWAEDGSVKKTVKCGVVDLGTLAWVFRNTYAYSPYIAGKALGACLAFLPYSIERYYLNVDGNPIFVFQEGAYTDAASFKAAMSGVMLVYELAEPIITDISDLITADNLIGVEGGGTLTFENEYGYAVPSEVEYQVEV